jgi:glycosyltransferase involved in cell wall biosynthesis
VQRYRVPEPRDLAQFDALSPRVYWQPHTEADEIAWMQHGGPWSPELFAAIAAQHDDFDLFIFMTYLYCSTFFGLPPVRHKAVLVPTAHDEPPIHLGIFRQVFTAPRYLIYLTPTERTMVRRFFDVAHIPDSEVSIGIDLPPPTPPAPAPLSLLYVGRVHTSKGCEELYDYTVRYKEIDPLPFRLVFAGRADITLPPHPDIEYPGFVSEDEKQRLLAACSVVVIPSPVESLSIIALEAWAAGRPVLVNGNCDVLREQVLRSNGGLFYRSYAEFAYCLGLLLHRSTLRAQLGQRGRAFVERWYNWPLVERRLEDALHQALAVVRAEAALAASGT